MFRNLRHSMPLGLAAVSLLAAGALASAAPASAAASAAAKLARSAADGTLLPFGSTGWKYKQVAHGDDPTFYQPSYNVSAWPLGQEGFGTTNGVCSWNNPTTVKTPWDVNTDMLVRHSLNVPSGTKEIHILGTIDNNADIYLNGKEVGSVQSGDCAAGAINVTLRMCHFKASNLLAIRGIDLGVGTYLNVEVTSSG